jgi:hypothetical protein
MLVIVLMQVDGVALEFQPHESNHPHNLAVIVLGIGDELNERNIEGLGCQWLHKPAEQREEEQCSASVHGVR